MTPTLPETAAWTHRGARSGFEVCWLAAVDGGFVLTGTTTAVEAGRTWVVEYEIRLDGAWRTRSAHVRGRSSTAARTVALTADGAGHWHVDGEPAPHLDGCLDVDLESSALTNALPVHRQPLPVGVRTAAPAAWVRAADLSVERLEQEYRRVDDRRLGYAAPGLGFTALLQYDAAGLVLEYPGIAVRTV